MSKVLCSVATRGRYSTTLPLTLQAIINQTKKVDKLVIFDDNDEPQDMRKELIYGHLFQILNIKGIPWEWLFAHKKGQHHIHQMANTMGYEWVWRVDDDAIPEPNVLERLYSFTKFFDNVGAVGGSILTPPIMDTNKATGKIELIDFEPNIQWGMIEGYKKVEHLHCSFLYRAGAHDYNLALSRVAHREETLFTYGLHQKGYDIYAVSDAVSWHLKNPNGGIRSETKKEMYEHDEQIFRNHVKLKDFTPVILNCGLGDHIVFSKVLPKIKNPFVFTCYPDVIAGQSIAEAQAMFGNIDQWNIYKKMDEWKWTQSVEKAFEKMYL
jgi:glycosyltransferase involved in cell wall biosynthesis